MTQPQTTAEVFWTACRAMKPKEREAFPGKLIKDKQLAEELLCSRNRTRKNEPTVSLDEYLAKRKKKK